MKIYFVRHGETEWNRIDRRQGRLDSPLTAKGLEQAKNNAKILSCIKIDIILSSPIGRALTTAKIIGTTKKINPIIKEELSECDYGRWTGLTRDEIEKRFPEEIKKREANKFNHRIIEGESYKDIQKRIKRFIDQIIKEDKDIAIVSHEIVGRTMIGYLLNINNEEMVRIKQPNNTIYQIEVDGDNRKISTINEDGSIKEGFITNAKNR